MKKSTAFFLITLTGIVLGSLYGVLHDQITYTISPEYYTKFKFQQFQLAPALFSNLRVEVCVVGILATWWMGLLISIVLGSVGLAHKTGGIMLRITLKAMATTMAVAFSTGLIGLLYGKFYLAANGVNWNFPDNLIDKNNFIAVGSMHNFSYLGGAIGLIVGIRYSLKQRKQKSGR